MRFRYRNALLIMAIVVSCSDDHDQVDRFPPPPVGVFTHVANNQTLRPTGDTAPQGWFSYPEEYYSSNPRVTYQAIDEPVSQSGTSDFIHACQCLFGDCQTHQYAFSDYAGSGPIEVHDIAIRMHVYACLDGYHFCGDQTAVVWIEASFFIQGTLQGSQFWYHYAGSTNCTDDVWEAQFSNLSYNRAQINSLEVRVKIGGQPFCQNSTLATIYSVEAECIAGEVHQGGCHCDPSG